MMASNDPLKPVPGAELSPEPSAMSKEAPTSTADETDVDMSSPTPTNAAMSETSPLSGGAAYTASGSPSKSKPSPLKSFKQKLPEVVTELKKQNERLTKENANVEAGVDDINLKLAAAGVKFWGQLVTMRNNIATGTLKLISKLDGPKKSDSGPASSAVSAEYPQTAAAAATAPTPPPAAAVAAVPPAAAPAAPNVVAAVPVAAPSEPESGEDVAIDSPDTDGDENDEDGDEEETEETTY